MFEDEGSVDKRMDGIQVPSGRRSKARPCVWPRKRPASPSPCALKLNAHHGTSGPVSQGGVTDCSQLAGLIFTDAETGLPATCRQIQEV